MTKGSDYCRKTYKDGGHISGAVYIGDDSHWSFINSVMNMYVTTNPLHIHEFMPLTTMEAEIIRMIANLYKGDENSCGIGTSGGTESILLAILAYREQGRIEKGIRKPNIVACETAHAAVDKACFYFGMEVRKAPVKKDLSMDVHAMSKLIDSNTVLIYCSGPEYPFGMYDPVSEVAALA